MGEAREFLALSGFRTAVFVGGASGLRATLQGAIGTAAGVMDGIGVPADFAGLYGRAGLELRLGSDPLSPGRGAYDVRRRMIVLEGLADQAAFAYAFCQALDHMLGDLVHGVVCHSEVGSTLLSAALPRYLGSGYRHERLNLLPPPILCFRFEGLPTLTENHRLYKDLRKADGDLVRQWLRCAVALRWRAREDGWVTRTRVYEEALRAEDRQNPEWAAPQNMMARAFAAWAASKNGKATEAGTMANLTVSAGGSGEGIDRRTWRIMEALQPVLQSAALEWRERLDERMAVVVEEKADQEFAMTPSGAA